MIKYQYIYNGIVTNVVDGDTIDVTVDLGFCMRFDGRFRLFGIDTPEINSKDVILRESAKKAKDRVIELILGKKVTIETFKQDKYGRYLADIYVSGYEDSVNRILITESLAKSYYGEKK